jgi:dihydropteroate synthase
VTDSKTDPNETMERMSFTLPPLTSPVRTIGARTIDFSRQVAVMAIVNRTPDSFYDGGANFALEDALSASLKAVEDGADWVDIGGVPFSPGDPLPVEEEADRVVPVVAALREASDVIISVDTFHAEVARRSIEAGATVVNDTTGLSDLDLVRVVADSEASLVIVHSLATPRTQYPRPHYADVASEVAAFLRERIELAVSLGVPEERIIIDPGHDLNKNTLHTLELTRRLHEVTRIGLPTMVALSNKDFIGETLDLPKRKRLEGSLAAAVACILQGARIVRVHEVPQTVAAVRMTEAILGLREPAYLKHNTMDFNVREPDVV